MSDAGVEQEVATQIFRGPHDASVFARAVSDQAGWLSWAWSCPT